MTGFKTYFKSINEDEGIVEAYVSVFGNVDLAGEMVVHGAFTKSLQKKLPKGVYMHDWSRPVSTTIEAEEVPAGDSRLPEQIKLFPAPLSPANTVTLPRGMPRLKSPEIR